MLEGTIRIAEKKIVDMKGKDYNYLFRSAPDNVELVKRLAKQKGCQAGLIKTEADCIICLDCYFLARGPPQHVVGLTIATSRPVFRVW